MRQAGWVGPSATTGEGDGLPSHSLAVLQPGQREGQRKEQKECEECKQRRLTLKMVLLTAKIMERTALFVIFGGLVTTLVTTFIPLWKTLNSELNEVENWYSGLWHICIFAEEVGMQCKAFESLMALPMDLLASRVLMLVSVGTGALAVVVAFPGLEGVELGSGRQQGLKRGLLIVSGVLSWVSGLTTLAPVSLVAYVTLVEFWDENLPDVVPRWEYGEAMFSGWFAGLFLVIGGSLFFVAVCMADHDGQQRVASLPNTPQEKPRSQYYLKTEVL
ncbi:putative claudin-24 [Salvelinus fontinalis]|nr:putative claudin-24 [Salvelinus fontinalis]